MLYLPAEFPLDPDLCYLNHAAIGPWPRRTAQVVANFAQQNMTRGGSGYPAWLEVEQRLRLRLARLINAGSADDIALIKNTSEGLSIVSQGLDWHRGDEVLGVSGDFCSNEMPWEVLGDRGVNYRPLDVLHLEDPEGALIDALSEQTRLLAISTVHFATGYRFDLARLSSACRARGVLLSVDAIQSLGAAGFDLQQVPADIVVAGGHKWLLSPEGLGFLYCRPELREHMSLHQFGWAMRARPYDFESATWSPAASARRFEAGTPNMTGIHAMDASLSLFEEVGMAFIEERLAENVRLLEDGLESISDVEMVTPRDPARRCGILTFRHPGVMQSALHAQLMKLQVICSPRAGGIRLSPHFYTPKQVLESTLDKINQTIQLLS
ncbi:MAG: aminotransferase class V-fold PLP-dependent enzyme [Chromatiaceae bacterium]|nr:aminotransferase class V-fold PLP-dependent enzyme [Chromatiaceae bacterium]